MSFSLIIFILLFPAYNSEDFLERYLTEKVHRIFRENNSVAYFVLGTNLQQGEDIEKKRHLLFSLDPCGQKNLTIMHHQVVCTDELVLNVLDRNKRLLQKMCDKRKTMYNTNDGFDVYWASEDTCDCLTTCPDTIVEMWPLCTCDPHETRESEIACDFQSCLWDWTQGFEIEHTRVREEDHTFAEAHIRGAQRASFVSPYYSQISSSCELHMYYNLLGPNAEIHLILEFMKIDGWRNTPQNVTLSTIRSFEGKDHILDRHLIRIGFVARPARIRVECLVSNGEGDAICAIHGLSWYKCGALDVSTTDCHNHQNPSVCQRDGHFMCLEDVECDGIMDCEDGSDEAHCDFKIREGSVCDFENGIGTPCKGWREISQPPQRFGKLYTTAKVLPDMTIIDSNGDQMFPRSMAAPLHSNLPNHILVLSPFFPFPSDSSQVRYSLISPKFPPTRQYSLDPFRPKSECTVRFRYCMSTVFAHKLPELYIISNDNTAHEQLLWSPSPTLVQQRRLCTWQKASIPIPRQLLPFQLMWSYERRSSSDSQFIAIDDFSIHPGCFDPSSSAEISMNHTLSTCEETGATVPQYDSCLREYHSRGGCEISIDPKTGIRNITIGHEGIYWVKLCGAAGGSFLQEKGGNGNCIVTTRFFKPGRVLSFVVGQKGESPCDFKPEKMSDEQELFYEYICVNSSNLLPDVRYNMGAGGGGASVLMFGLNVSLVAGGGGGAYPDLPKLTRDINTTDGFGFSFTNIKKLPRDQCKLCIDPPILFTGYKKVKHRQCNLCEFEDPPTFFLEKSCWSKDKFLTYGGYGGGGPSCGTGGGGGGGMKGGEPGRLSAGEAGSNQVTPSIHSKPIALELMGVNDGDGSIEILMCNLVCPKYSYCDFASSSEPKMECVCGEESMLLVNGACTEISNGKGRIGYPWVIGGALVFCLLALSFWLITKCKIIYNKGKKYIGKGADCNGEGTELLDMKKQESEILELLNNKNFLKTLTSDKLKNLMPQLDDARITLIEDIGKGAFGNVSRALLRDSNGRGIEIAVKVLKEDPNGDLEAKRDTIRDFLMEAVLIRATNLCDTTNTTIKLIGVSFNKAPYKIVMELMKGGNLEEFLRSSRASEVHENPNKLSMKDLFQFAADIAGGCATLEKMQFLHRDLAARNCLLTCQGRERRVKIGDFGLATELYHQGGNYVSKSNKRRAIPIKWMPPEAIIDGKFSTKTDVWSFGVVCWEIFTVGKMPFAGLSSDQVFHMMEEGTRLPRPKNCPDEMYQVMLECWQSDPDNRPPFAFLCDTFDAILQDPKWQNAPIPLVYAPEKVSSPVLESPVFNPSAGTPCTVETTLPTPMGEGSWNGSYEGPNTHVAEEKKDTRPPPIIFKYDNPMPQQINNDSYFVGYSRHNNVKQQERPTELPLAGPKFRPMS